MMKRTLYKEGTGSVEDTPALGQTVSNGCRCFFLTRNTETKYKLYHALLQDHALLRPLLC